MKFRSLGRTGLQVSALCLGAFNFGGATPRSESVQIIHTALDRGINMIDTANYYNKGRSEEIVGEALAGPRREKVILATKFHYPVGDGRDPNARGNSRRHIMQAVEASLKRLKTDWIDLYQIHRPDFSVPQDETLRALDDLVHQGKVRYVGSSTFPAWMVMEALAISQRHQLARFVTEQPPYNLLDRRVENELVPLALRHGLSLLPWSPLAMGLLAGRYASPASYPTGSRADRIGSIYAERITRQAVERGNLILPIAKEAGLTPAQLALSWLKDQPAVAAPIIGPRTLQHLLDALPVLEQSLSPEILAALDQSYPPGSAFADFHNTSGWMKMTV